MSFPFSFTEAKETTLLFTNSWRKRDVYMPFSRALDNQTKVDCKIDYPMCQMDLFEKIFILDRNTWNHIAVCKLFILSDLDL